MNRVTIATITYNQENYIRQALESFVSQKTNFEFSVIISDDCSTDGTSAIIQEFARQYPHIIFPVFHETNIGVQANYIETLSRIATEFAVICEGDDYFTDIKKLQKQVDYLDTHKEISLCFHPVNVIYEGKKRSPSVFPSNSYRFNKSLLTVDDLLKRNFIQTNSAMYRWRFTQNGSFESTFPKDILPCDHYLHLLHAQVGGIAYINGNMAVYRRHPSGIWDDSDKDERKFYLKYGIDIIGFYVNVLKNIAKDKELYIKDALLPSMRKVINTYLDQENVELFCVMLSKYKIVTTILHNLISGKNNYLELDKKYDELKNKYDELQKKIRIVKKLVKISVAVALFVISAVLLLLLLD